MSGTSMDGIDAALLQTDGSALQIEELGSTTFSYQPLFKILLKSVEYAIKKYAGDLAQAKIHYPTTLKEFLQLELKVAQADIDNKISELSIYCAEITHKSDLATASGSFFSIDDIILHSTQLHCLAVRQLLEQTGFQAAQIDVIGYHGQTMFHQPARKLSLVLGEGQIMADTLGITVVNNFRAHDVAQGGEGAPFAPLFHQALAIRDKKIPMAVVNCGGIANVTFIPSEQESDLIAFDTGPGNGLIDRLIRQRTQGREHMDKNGQYGKKGKVNENVLSRLYEKAVQKAGVNYLLQPPPKSLDISDLQFIPELDVLSIEDACVTLEIFTARTIVNSIEWMTGEIPRYWILAGGGWNNPVIYHELKNQLKERLGEKISICTASEGGWNSQALEAQIFAFFAVRSLQNKPLSFPGTTGVIKPLSGGQAYIPRRGATAKIKELIQKNPAVLSGYLISA